MHAATNFGLFVRLLRSAERRLIQCHHGTLADRLHIFSGIYYGTEWSLDFRVERSRARNIGFQTYLQQLYTDTDDPRACLGCGLFLSLQRSQDTLGVDMGHVMIGLNARTGFLSRETSVPFHGATGLELTTWVGDLGGAAARLALDRAADPRASSARYFRGTDYGAPSNLEGDIAAHLIAAGASDHVTAPVVSSDDLIANAVESYFVRRIGYPNRRQRFLELQGGQFSNDRLTNRAEIEVAMALKLASFGRIYAANFLRSRGRFSFERWWAARAVLGDAAAEVARVFIDWLLAR